MSPLKNSLFEALRILRPDKKRVRMISTQTAIPDETLRFWDKNFLLPSEVELEKLCAACGVSPIEVKLRMGIVDREMMHLLQRHAGELAAILPKQPSGVPPGEPIRPRFETEFGALYEGNCIEVMRQYPSGGVQMIFADPPFNLDKEYPSKMDDKLRDEDYLSWCYAWIDECVRILAANGSLFIYNLPKWNITLAEYLSNKLIFRDWITIDIKGHLPLSGRLYPSHYSLIYFCKGERPHVFHPDRVPMRVCPHCFGDLVDYGGYKNKMNPNGVNLTDVWTDIPLVRHSKYKKREGANELSIKLLDRVIEMATDEGDLVFDPFGGSGTTYVVAEVKRRRWAGAEIGPLDDIIRRIQEIDEERELLQSIRANYNQLFTASVSRERAKRRLWTCESVRCVPDDPQLLFAGVQEQPE